VQSARLLMALFGERAYFEALARAGHEDENERDPSHWFAVLGLDRTTQYLGR
jgi:hypothetical protein